MLASHTYFLLLPLGLVAKPFGAPGLLFVLAASAGAAYFWAARVLRLLGVTGFLALLAAGLLLASPLSVAFYQESFYGFHVEVLTPMLCLILFYFLLRQRIVGSIVAALVVISVKEDAPIAAAMVAIVAGIETWISSPGKSARYRLNWPAVITLFLSVLAIPLLLAISWSQPPTAYAPHSVRSPGYGGSGKFIRGREHFSFSSPRTWIIGLVAMSSVSGYGFSLLAALGQSFCVHTIWLSVFRQRWSPGLGTGTSSYGRHDFFRRRQCSGVSSYWVLLRLHGLYPTAVSGHGPQCLPPQL